MELVVHGGAGAAVENPAERSSVLERAVRTGQEAETALTAAIEAVGVLETDPGFNAGLGGAVQSDGVVRTDAGVMTNDRSVGAVCSMPGVVRASEVARVVLEDTPHVLIAGEQAVSLAENADIATDCDLLTERTTARWNELDPPDETVDEQLSFVAEQFTGSDTVGAVATDGEEVVSCTSTGGRWCALAGRVGDVPQVGSGFYCTHAGGASATGHGEAIARVTLARRAVDHLELGRDPETAASLAIEELAGLTDGRAGIIVMDPEGKTGSAYNTEQMQTARS